jgi:hypothetical protein
MRGWFREACAWIGTPLARRASELVGRCGQVIHNPSALKSAPWRAIPALSPFSPSLRQRRVLLQYKRTKRVEDVSGGLFRTWLYGAPSISTSASQFTGAFSGNIIPIDERACMPTSDPYTSRMRSE